LWREKWVDAAKRVLPEIALRILNRVRADHS